MSLEKYNISLKRDVLVLTENGKLSKKKIPHAISSNNKYIKETDNNYLIKVSSPLCNSSKKAYEKFCEITNVLAEELYKQNELIWPLDNFLNDSNDIDLTATIYFSFAKDLIEDLKVNYKKLKINEDFYTNIKSDLLNINSIKIIFEKIRLRVMDNRIVIENIMLDSKDRYGITENQIRFLIACLFLGLQIELDRLNKSDEWSKLIEKNMFKALEKVNKQYNLKAEEAISIYYNIYKEIKQEQYKPELYSFEKALKLAKKYMNEYHLERYTIKNHEKLVAETKALIKDAIAQGIDYEILNEAKSIVELSRGKHKEIVIEGNKTDRDTYIFPNITDDKLIAKNIMSEAGINVPNAILLTKDMNDIDLDELLKPYYNTKLVVKPRNTNYGTGITVFSKPANKTRIIDAVKYAFEFDNNVLIEEYVKGMEYRFLCVDGKCISVAHRRIASVVGDGKSSINQLIDNKNKEQWHYLTGCPLKKDKPVIEYLKTHNLTFDSVIQKGKRVFLRTNSNCSTGGESIDYTEIMPTRFKHIAEKAAAAFDAKICGVDIIIEDLEKNKYSIIEINDNPGYSINEWPYEGKGERIGVNVLKLLKLVK